MRVGTLMIPLALGALHLAPAVSQQPPSDQPAAQVLVLGVYHMSNPGHDLFNTQADDVLAPKRQGEIAELIAVLQKFQPTKIAVEADFSDSRTARNYNDYLAGTHQLSSNEVEQIGFRLARELGHKTVYPVDADGEFPFQHLVNYAKAAGRSAELNALMDEVGAMVKEQSAYLASHTVLETLLYMNADQHVARDVGFYYREAQFGEPWDWAGPDLVADWFRRNMRIYGNVTRLIDAPSDRVLVIFGAGHLGWLRHDFASNPTLRLRTLAEFAR